MLSLVSFLPQVIHLRGCREVWSGIWVQKKPGLNPRGRGGFLHTPTKPTLLSHLTHHHTKTVTRPSHWALRNNSQWSDLFLFLDFNPWYNQNRLLGFHPMRYSHQQNLKSTLESDRVCPLLLWKLLFSAVSNKLDEGYKNEKHSLHPPTFTKHIMKLPCIQVEWLEHDVICRQFRCQSEWAHLYNGCILHDQSIINAAS